mmetsp:Transcript_81459/g.217899  ORF Transcript_81459/g.217899 Transcript_81459/m.217899 type:complete len:146 (+) Transcript_81459:268-705(+)
MEPCNACASCSLHPLDAELVPPLQRMVSPFNTDLPGAACRSSPEARGRAAELEANLRGSNDASVAGPPCRGSGEGGPPVHAEFAGFEDPPGQGFAVDGLAVCEEPPALPGGAAATTQCAHPVVQAEDGAAEAVEAPEVGPEEAAA